MKTFFKPLGIAGFLTGVMIQAVLATSPPSPTGVIAVAGNAQATISWTASVGSSGVLGYTVTSSPDGKTCTTTGALTCTVTGLTNGTTYTFTVVEVTSAGAGGASAASATVTPKGPPSAPTSVAAIPGNGYILVSWSPSSCSGCGPATSYTATANPGGQTCSTTIGMSCSITGLSVGAIAYTFTVVATNSTGSSEASTPSNVVNPPVDVFPIPAAPIGVTAFAGNGQASVSWSAGTCNSCGPATSYTVTSNPGDKTCLANGVTTCIVAALTNGTAYTFTVVGTNSFGSSAASAPSVAVTPMAPTEGPGFNTPTLVSAIAGNAQATVSWQGTGSTEVIGYTATSTPDGKTCTTTGALICTVTGLTNGTTYTFKVVELTSSGASAASAASPAVTPKGVPGAPTGITVTRGNGQAMVTWTAPASNGGSPIIKYTATAVSDTTKHCSTTGATSCMVTGLVNEVAYTFMVTATNAVGTGPAQATSADPTFLNPSLGSSNILLFQFSSTQLFVTLPGSFLGTNIRASIFTVNGNKVREVNAGNSATGIAIPLGNLTNGIYLFELQSEDTRMARTFSLMR